MAQRGRPPKPAEQKRRTGNPGGRALPAVASLAVVPAMDAAPELDAAATVAAVLAEGVHWIAQTDAPSVVMLKELLEERVMLRDQVMSLPFCKDRSKALRDLDKAVSERLSALGFDPAARSRLGLAEVRAKSKLEELRERQAKQRGAAMADANK